jgi:protein-ribulosamine 3-kinase
MSSSVHTLLDLPQPEALEIAGDFPLNENVIAALPEGVRVLSSNRSGTSAWTVTGRIIAELADGTPTQYFIKCATTDRGRRMMEGEFTSMKELHKAMPNFVPRPYTW